MCLCKPHRHQTPYKRVRAAWAAGRQGEMHQLERSCVSTQLAGVFTTKPLYQHLLNLPNLLSVDFTCNTVLQSDEPVQSLDFYLTRHLVLHSCRLRARARAVGEHKGRIKPNLLHYTQCVFKLLFRFPRIAQHEIGGNRDSGNASAELLHNLTKLAYRIASMHVCQERIIAYLQR